MQYLSSFSYGGGYAFIYVTLRPDSWEPLQEYQV
jgi:hypothetical protein